MSDENDKKEMNPVFEKYMNTPLHQGKRDTPMQKIEIPGVGELTVIQGKDEVWVSVSIKPAVKNSPEDERSKMVSVYVNAEKVYPVKKG